MSQIQESLETLVMAIKSSKEYQKYIRAKEELSKYPDLQVRVDELRKQNYEMQHSDADILSKTEQLWEAYASEAANSVVWEYMSAEAGFCRCIQQINWTLLEELDFDADFLLEKEN